MTQGDTRLILDITRRAARSLQRDFFELENLQSSVTGNNLFVQKSRDKVFQTLHTSLSKYYQTLIFNHAEVKYSNFIGHAAFVETLDGLDNFVRSLSHFAIMITIVSKHHNSKFFSAERSIINFPALGEIYYAEKGKGAWVEKHALNITGVSRARVSGYGKTDNMIIATSNHLIKHAMVISSNLRIFNSYTYSLVQLITGKIDAVMISHNPLILPGIQLFIKESGGACRIEGDYLVASNFRLSTKL